MQSDYPRSVIAAQELWVEDKLHDACGYLEHMLQRPKSKASVEYANLLDCHHYNCRINCHKVSDA